MRYILQSSPFNRGGTRRLNNFFKDTQLLGSGVDIQAGLQLNIQKTKIMASGPITSWQIDVGTMESVTDYFLELQNYCRW